MIQNYIKIKPGDLKDNVIQLIGKQWMLITAGNKDHFNTMTASWGGIGELWNKPVAFIFIRPTRYTYEFIESEEYFTCCFFEEKHRDKLNFCGKYSGRDCNKAADAHLTPLSTSHSMYFDEARLVIECRKMYYQDINPENFIDPGIQVHYPKYDYHRQYIAEITSVWIRKEN